MGVRGEKERRREGERERQGGRERERDETERLLNAYVGEMKRSAC